MENNKDIASTIMVLQKFAIILKPNNNLFTWQLLYQVIFQA